MDPLKKFRRRKVKRAGLSIAGKVKGNPYRKVSRSAQAETIDKGKNVPGNR